MIATDNRTFRRAAARYRFLRIVLLLLPLVAFGQEVLMREVVSREMSYQVEPGFYSPLAEAFSREVSFFVEPAHPDAAHEVISREVSYVLSSTNPPPKIENLAVAASPTGENVTLDWSSYNQWAIGDIDHFEIYYTADGAFSNINDPGLTLISVPANSTSFTIEGLPAFTDHYFAVVAVDALGQSIASVNYAASYVLSPETLSREYSYFVEPSHPEPFHEIIAREVSYVVSSTNPPPAVPSFDVLLSPNGDTATLNWADYDQYAIGDIARFDIYYTDNGAFSDTGEPGLLMVSVPAGSTSVVLEGLAPFTDHYFAVVPVDAHGNYISAVSYGAGYVISPEVISREVSYQVEPAPNALLETVSREVSFLVPDAAVPPPVTGLNSGFEVTTSSAEFSAVRLDFTAYDEQAAMDVVGYDVYVGSTYFEDVAGLAPFTRLPAGNQLVELSGLSGGTVLYFAVVAVDALGNFNPVVRAQSALTSIAGVGEVVNFSVTGGSISLSYAWGHPPDSDDFRTGYRIYFDGTNVPVNLPANATTWQATNLEAARGYFCKICSVDGFGTESDGISIPGATWLPNPQNLSLSEQGAQVVLAWAAAEPSQFVQYYEIYRDSAPIADLGGRVPVLSTPLLSAPIGPLAEVENQWFAVATVNILGDTDPAVESIQVFKLGQTIDFPPIVPGALQIPLAATASSGLPVRYTVSPSSIASIAGSNSLSVIKGGTVRVTAIQDGNANYWPAEASQTLRLPPVIQSFTADGLEIFDGMVLSRDHLLQVTALDADGIDSTEFRIREVGAGSWTVLGGGASANLPVSSLPAGNYEVQVEVAAAGSTASRTHTIVLDLQPVLSMALGEDLFEGMELEGSVSIQRARGADLVVTIGSSVPTQVDPGPPVTILAGQTGTTFRIFGRQDSVIEDDLQIRITATAPGAIQTQRTVTLLDDDWPSVSLSLNRTIVPESAGPNAVQAQVERSPVTSEPLVVWLENSDPTAASVPVLVTIPANESVAGFPIGAVDDDLPDGPQIAEIQAFVRLSGAGDIAQSEIQTLEVGDDEGPVLELAASNDWIFEGETEPLTVIRHGGDTNEAIVVSFEVDQPLELLVPASAGIGTNETVVLVDVQALDSTNGSRRVMITASAAGYGPGQLALVVTDEIKPDFVLSNLDAPVLLGSEETFDVSFTLENRGSGPSSGPFVQRIFFSEDAVPGDDILLAQEAVALDMAVDESRDLVVNVRAPQRPGTYRLFVIADAGLAIDEIIEWNNSAIFPLPIVVDVPWSATVQTDAELVPADTPILFYGSAVRGDTEKVPFATVNVHIRRGETERIVSALTDANGDYELLWQPLPGEGGDYEVGACHPGTTDAPTQDSFTILAATAEIPEGIRFTQGGGTSFTGTVHNPTAYDLTGLGLQVIGAPTGLDVDALLADSLLPAGGSLDLAVTLGSAGGLSGTYEFTILITSDQGVTVGVPVSVEIVPLLPKLAINPSPLKASVLRGSSKTVGFTISNSGGQETGPVKILLPDTGWIRLVSPGSLASIPPGGSAAVSLRLQPEASQPLTLYEGNMVLAPQNGVSRNLPFAFRVVSDATGDLQVEVKDEFSYFAEGNPPAAGVGVVLRDAVTAEQLLGGTTGSDGRVRFDGIAEGWYTLEVDSPNHIRTVKTIQLRAGELNEVSVFASRELVKYRWTVEEVDLNDRYKISIESTFEANVPAPVVTVTPSVLDVSDLDELGETKVVNMVIENHGWINADRGAFSFGSHPYYSIEPLIKDVGTIPAKSAIVVPVVMRRIALPDTPQAQSASATGVRATASASAACSMAAQFVYSYVCGVPIPRLVPIGVSGVQGDCSGETGPITGGGGSGSGGIAINPVSFGSSMPCCPEKAGDDWCYDKETAINTDLLGYVLVEGVSKVLSYSPYPFAIYKTDVKLKVEGKLCICCEDGEYGYLVQGTVKGDVEVEFGIGKGVALPDIEWEASGWNTVTVSGNLLAGARVNLKGSFAITGTKPCFGESTLCGKGSISGAVNLGGSVRGAATATATDNVSFGGEVEGNLGLTGNINVEASVCGDEPMKVKACGSITADAFLKGTLKATVLGEEQSRSIGVGGREVLFQICSGESPQALGAKPLAEDEPLPAIEYTIPQDEFWLSDAEVFELLDVPQGGGVCAQVRIAVDQEAVMTRSAFRASLELENTQDSAELTEVGFELEVRDSLMQVAGERFNVQVTELEGLEAIDGTGTIGANATGRAQWTLIPRDTAAPVQDTTYTIGGTISYVQGGVRLSIPVQRVPITVKPDAALHLKYFHQRDVVSDDPHTDPIEAKQPFALAVVVENRGAGSARNLSITSAQPQIVDNEKGLLIDFEIIGSEIAGEPRSASLVADFGDIGPGQQKTAVWWMTASLHGFFQDYEATFEHLDGFGDPRISLIKDVQIYEMVRLASATGELDDGQPDFFTNEALDPGLYPVGDTLHLSDGSVTNVAYLGDGAACSNVTAGQLVVDLVLTNGSQAGWTYLRFPDPADGAFRLVQVVRSDGLVIPVGTNVWTTDRTFYGMGTKPVYENFLHLLDRDSTGSYTLHYGAIPADSAPPQSSVAALPANSGIYVPVSWSGSDDIAVASFDIMVSTNNGPWGVWLKGTTRISSLFLGDAGNSYAFYSVAIDSSGNRESKTPGAEAFTTISEINLPPVLNLIAATNIAEGATLNYQVVASDPDGPADELGYSVVAERTGVTVDANGLVSWPTSELDGGTSNRIQVSVIDAGLPVGLTSAWFTVTVDEVNQPPVFESLGPQTVAAGKTLVVRAQATDADFPAQSIYYSLGASSPAGMIIDPLFGLIEWTAPTGMVGQSVAVDVVAGDDGVPAAYATNRFTISVLERILDTTPPLPVTDLAVTPDTGISDSDGIIAVTNFTLVGTLPETGLQVEVYLTSGGGALELLATDQPYGLDLLIPLEVDRVGDIDLVVRCIDGSGNATDSMLGLFIDLEAPVVELLLDGVLRDATNYLELASARMIFSETVNLPGLIADGLADQAVRVSSTNGWVVPAVDDLAWHSASNTLVWSIPANAFAAGDWMLQVDGAFVTDVAGNHLVAAGAFTEQGLPGYGSSSEWAATYSYAAPAWHDFNGDGLGDLLVGEKTAASLGQVRIYLNEGSATNPVFSAYSLLEVDGAPLVVPASGCLGISLRLADLTGDGLADLLAGRSDGTVWLYETASIVSNAWNIGAATQIWSGATRAMVDVFDLDTDGTNEVMVGGMDGRFVVIDSGSNVDIGLQVAAGRSAPAVADLNGDGLPELVSGDSDGDLWSFFGNARSNAWNTTAWPLAETPDTWSHSRPCVGDVNADGWPDILLGTADGRVRVFIGQAPRNPALGFRVIDPGERFTLTASSGAGGHLEPEGAVAVYEGENQSFAIVPDSYWHVDEVFANGVSLGAVLSHTFSNVVENGLIHATFAQNMVTNAPVPVPEEWLAGYGWTNNFAFAVTNDFDGDGFAAWEEYVAGTSPLDRSSVFRITQIRSSEGDLQITWAPSMAGRRYRLMRADTPGGAWSEVGVLDGPADTLTVPATAATGMFRVEVALSEAPPQWTVIAFAGANGTITPSGLQYATPGSNAFHFVITPDQWFHVADVKTNGVSVGAVESLTLSNVTANLGIQAEFAQNLVANAPVPVPEAWLAGFGWTNNFEFAVTNDSDGDGFAAWEEYVAGSTPTNKISFFRITQIRNLDGSLLISWTPSVEKRRYRLMRADTPGGDWAEVAAIDGPADSLTVPATSATGMFRMEVALSDAPPQWTVIAFAGPHGTITPSGLQYAAPGSNSFHFEITPDRWHHIADVTTNGVSVGAVESLALSGVTANLEIRAEFAQNLFTNAPVPVPEVWLAEYGWTNNFASAVTNDSDGDGFVAWEEYVAGSTPTNKASFFHITQIVELDGSLQVSWTPSVEKRRYRVMLSPALGEPFTEEVGTVLGPADSIILPASQSHGMLLIMVELVDISP
jgi:hypothetical protein